MTEYEFDRTPDGEITCVTTDDGELILDFDPDGDFAQRIEWMAGHRGEDPEEFIEKAVREHLEDDEVNR